MRMWLAKVFARLSNRFTSWALSLSAHHRVADEPASRREDSRHAWPSAPEILPPTAHELDRARGWMIQADVGSLKVCRGSKKGCVHFDNQPACRDCYSLPWHDRRPSDEILASMERGDA